MVSYAYYLRSQERNSRTQESNGTTAIKLPTYCYGIPCHNLHATPYQFFTLQLTYVSLQQRSIHGIVDFTMQRFIETVLFLFRVIHCGR